ncbi:thiamine diphosphate-binding protein [Pterulicium gracile]|uniref:Thiamine diphosphate-binding protein n=1 Tax=Pterulicium gracile TaxID=1884261 RepID=A0A5C3Q812_9AGAR|nr:thiamine diphosphate-binding protein [Pterula gracilis]
MGCCRITLDPKAKQLSAEQKADLKSNIQLLRDAIVLFTATGAARGVGGHTGGAYDTVPEVCIILGLYNNTEFKTVPTVFDEAGHRVATQYILSALEGALPAEHLLFYRAANSKLPGHPELGLTPGVKFSSGRLGHMWPLVNGVAMANPGSNVFLLGSDGSQQEGNDAEAARLAVAQNLNVKLLIDDNNVTIAGHPSDYLKGYEVSKTLEGHGLKVITVEGEDIDSLWGGISTAIATDGPVAVISKRKMAPGISGIEGSPHGHDVVSVDGAVNYLKERGYGEEVWGILKQIQPTPDPILYVGSTKERAACRVEFGEAVSNVLRKISPEQKKKVMVIDSDLEGSTGLKVIHKNHPDVFIPSGIMERGNFSAAAGFGFDGENQGIFSTFSAFLEMIVSEITMARLNNCNVLSHFSHSGVDEMCDNTCHFGLNSFFADNGLSDAAVATRLYFPADAAQMHAVINKVLFDKGLRFVFSTRSKVPYLLKENSNERFYDDKYEFVPGKDEVLVEGKDGYVVTYGEMTYRAWDAVLRVRRDGTDVGFINKSTLNVVDEDVLRKIGTTKFVLVVESMNQNTSLGSKMGSWLLERQLTPRYGYMGSNKEGCGGMWEQIPHQGLDPQSIILKIKQLAQ